MDGRRYFFVAVLALALAARIGAGVWWQNRLPEGTRLAFGDSESYWFLARTIAQGEPYRYGVEQADIFRTPGYPLLLAPLFLIFGPEPPVMAARVLSALLGTASVASVMGLARTLFEDRVALVAGFATAIDPGAITLGTFVLSEAPFCPLMMLNLWAWVLAWHATDRRTMLTHAAWGGGAAGLAILMRPSWLLFLPFAALIGLILPVGWAKGRLGDERPTKIEQATWWAAGRLGSPWPTLQIAGMMLVTLSLTMTPWWIRNYSITGRFIPTTLQVGASLYDGLGPQADGSSNMEYVAGFIEEQRRSDEQATVPPTDTFEERLDQRMRTASLAWAKENPQRVAELVGIKLLRMWSPWPNAADLGSFVAKLAIAAGYVPLIGFGLVGLWRYGRRDWSYVLLALPAVYFTLLHVIFVSSLRYRQPAMLLIAILAAAVIIEMCDRYRSANKLQVLSAVP